MKILRATLFSLSIALASILALACPAFGYTSNTHNEFFEAMFFGDDYEPYVKTHIGRGDKEGKAILYLEEATYLCIDQYGPNGKKGDENKLRELRKYVGSEVPGRLSMINPAGTGLAHRTYTHQGWDHNYASDSYYAQTTDSEDHQEKWLRRKTILLGTTEKVFDFTFLPTALPFVNYDEKCQSLAAIMYYTHVLGDYIQDSNYDQFFNGTNGKKIPFAAAILPSDMDPDLFYEIEKHLDTLFANQAEGRTVYNDLRGEIDTLASKARKVAGSSSMSHEEAYELQHEYAEQLMAMLTGQSFDFSKKYDYANRINMLLMNEDYFRNVFVSL